MRWLCTSAMYNAPSGPISTPNGSPTLILAAGPVSVWQSLTFWRGLSIGSPVLAAACVATLVYVGMRPMPPATPRAPLLATLTGAKTKMPNFVAAIGTDGRSLTIVPAALLTADKRSMELWLIPEGGKPASLGLISAGQPVQLNLPPELLKHVGTGATLAVSLEPLGGSPTGQPTGEVIAHGNLSRL